MKTKTAFIFFIFTHIYGFRRGLGSLDVVTKLVTDIQIALSKNEYLVCLFLDIKGAYDSVDLNILKYKMCSLGFNNEICNNILNLYTNRTIWLKDHRNILHGPRVVNQGLPQGSVLSPTLFNLYSASIHSLFDENIKCLQYADDICIYSTQKTYDDCLRSLRHIVEIIIQWTNENNMTMSTEKSNIMFFTRHRLRAPGNVTSSGRTIPVVNQYKYLGIVLDNKLLWTKHIQYIKGKCEKKINILRCITNRKWGADPKTALLFYNACIRSVVDYGCWIYGSASNTNLKILDRIQYRCLRICLSAMVSTPINVMLAECNEIPLNLRRQFLAQKYCIKLRNTESDLLTNLALLNMENLTSKYWRIKNSPPLTDAFIETRNYTDLHKSKLLPIYKFPYKTLIKKPRIIIPKYTESNHLNNILVKSILSDFVDYTVIYTDGSKNQTGVGCAMYVQNTHQHNNYKLSSISSIFTAEIIAIEKALEWIKENNIEKAVIITDSRSAIYAIENTDFSSYKSKILCNIKNNLSKVEVVFIWAKGHAGILGNEKVDELAKDAIKKGEILTHILSTDAINDVKVRINKIWKKEWKNITSMSKNLYFSLHQELPPPPEYIFKYNLPKQDISTIVRLKTRHGKYEAHLHKLGIINSSVCFCDNVSIRDLNHIFLECKINERYINQLYYNLRQTQVHFPISIEYLLSCHKMEIFKLLINYLKETNIII